MRFSQIINHSNFDGGSSTHGSGTPLGPTNSPPRIAQPLTYASSPGTILPDRTEYAHPPGRPLPHRNEYAPPPGNPNQRSQYTLPQDHPTGHGYAPPIWSPPSQSVEKPIPDHDCNVISDTALLPPLPSFRHESNPLNNANLAEADRAHEWCRRYHLKKPHMLTPAQHSDVINVDVSLMKPREFNGELSMVKRGFWKGSARTGARDSCLITAAPLYFVCADIPVHSGVSKTIYFEVKLRSLGSQHRSTGGSFSLGFCGMPYPTWRLPGWERASLAVHGDDSRRYVNNTYGGMDFTSPFQVGDTMGLGIKFAVPENPPASSSSSPTLNIEVFFTRNGKLDGSWNVHEELDSLREIEGLDGTFDLYGALGTFGSVEFDCAFRRADWLWQAK